MQEAYSAALEFRFLICVCGLLALPGLADGQQRRTWGVDGVEREALVQRPTKSTSDQHQDQEIRRTPLVFVFHGHGGTMGRMAKKGFQQHWPEAMFVFPQGLPTKSGRDPEGKRAGWQNRAGVERDRDLKFFDAMLATFVDERKFADPLRVYTTGHSNGAGFTYLLWGQRRDVFAAVAASAGGAPGLGDAQPLPVFHLVGRTDPVVPYENQKRTIDRLKQVNEAADKPGSTINGIGDRHASPHETPVVVYEHGGGHEFIDDADERIVAFFKRHKRPIDGYSKRDKPLPADPSLATIEKAFRRLDRNNDGTITREEMNRPAWMKRFDQNGDGKVERSEVGLDPNKGNS